MTKQIKNIILFLILALSTNASFCYTLTPQELKEEISAKVNSQIKEQLKNYSSDFKINITGIPATAINTSEVQKPKIEVISQNNSFQANSFRRVMVRNSDGSLVKAFPITIQTRVYADVLVAKEIIGYNEAITGKNSQIERKEISRYLGKTYSNFRNDLISKRNYQAGIVIVANYVKEKSCIMKNSNIDIVFQSKAMNIKIKGIALKEGSIGDTILVRSDKYNKTYTGIVKSENEVMVRI